MCCGGMRRAKPSSNMQPILYFAFLKLNSKIYVQAASFVSSSGSKNEGVGAGNGGGGGVS